MPPALRKRPFRTVCAAATHTSTPQQPEPERLVPAHPVTGSGR
ncbi:hypothetical protein [Streptomyces rubiginosohelvolus]|uniref:Uncharacterized protein n=1 Tax=Streptomyces rubiginosohelvolus TaxID=67362 RepID=A0ABW6ES97_9ACTN